MALPPPRDSRDAPRALLTELASHLGESAAAARCADLLDGADPLRHAEVLAYLGGRPAAQLLAGDSGWPTWWARVWGARGLRYVWHDAAEGAVLAGLEDQRWRVVEHCLALVAAYDLGPAGDCAVAHLEHELARVRVAACRALAVAADTEHLGALVDCAASDPEPRVRTAARRAAAVAADRLDLPPADSSPA